MPSACFAFRAFVAATTAALVAGCVNSPRTALDVDESGVITPSARFVIGAQDGVGFELGVSGARGRASQSTRAGDPPVEIGDGSFPSPDALRNEVQVRIADAAVRLRRFTGDGLLGLELLGGVSLMWVDITTTNAQRSASEDRTATGLLLGIGGIWRVRPGTEVQARYSLASSFGDWLYETDVHRVELALAQALGRHVSLRGGYQVWSIDSKSPGSSEVNARLRGPMLGVEITF